MPEAYTSRVANRLGAVALTLSDAIRDAVEDATGMSGGAPAALISLHEWADGRSVEVLADAMRVSHSRAVRVVDGLEAAGLARRQRSPDDGRRALVVLESEGHALAEQAMAARAAVLLEAVASLDADDTPQLDRLLGPLLAARTHGSRTAAGICRMCDAHTCGHFDGSCPVSIAADAARRAGAA
jgi:DNA-binding MarR family transcriptional regulator